MKYIHAAAMITSLIAAFASLLLGVDYYSESQGYRGLHPALATILTAAFLTCGYISARNLEASEE